MKVIIESGMKEDIKNYHSVFTEGKKCINALFTISVVSIEEIQGHKKRNC